jgi:N-acetylglucosaminyl-diphospho-decaprenol L-rhamnosyltransferase
MKRNIGISIVSHQQGGLVRRLLDDLEKYCASGIEVILILNVWEELPFQAEEYGFPIRIIANRAPKGFGANHNHGFKYITSDFFCVMNPDIRLQRDPFVSLLRCLDESASGLVAPLIVNEMGEVADSARKFPSPFSIFKKMLRSEAEIEYKIQSQPISPEWVAGM